MKASAFFAFAMVATGMTGRADWPDISTVAPDLEVPALADAGPAPGLRVKEPLPAWRDTSVYHVLYLPTDWRPAGSLPVLLELAGNGNYSNKYGDVSIGRPEGSRLGYGLSAGCGFIWICVPFVNARGTDIAIQWWGDKPSYDPAPTIAYCTSAVAWVCGKYGGDSKRVVLCGFSRGAIACNFIGLHDDGIAKLWRGFIAYSHYDGVRTWPYPGSARASALARLGRLDGRPQFICPESGGIEETEKYLSQVMPDGNFTFVPTGFRNHNDAWTLRPSKAREAARKWLHEITSAAGERLSRSEQGP